MAEGAPAAVEPRTAFDPTASVPPLANLRDVGGLPTRDGCRVRPGRLWRSTDLGGLDETGIEAVARLGIRTVYDLRTDAERARRPDRLPEGTRLVAADVLADDESRSPAAFVRLMADPEAARAAFGGGAAARLFEENYRQFVLLGSARRALGRMYADLAVPEHRPGLVHCATGKDRTGWAVAALLLLLGVPDEAILGDYLASNEALRGFFEPQLAAWEAQGGDRSLLEPLTWVRAGYLEASIGVMRERYGDVEGYFLTGLGLAPTIQRALREAFVEPA